MGGGSGSSTTQTVQKADPWAGQQPYLYEQFAAAQNLFNNKTPQYNMDAFNQAKQTYNQQQAMGGVPSFTSLQARKLGYTGNWGQDFENWLDADPNRRGQYQGTFESQAPGWDRALNDAEMQEARQYGGGPAPKMEDFLIPGTENSSALAPAYYQGQTIADQAPETLLAQDLTTNRALTGSPVMNNAQGLLSSTLQGDYLNSNPYLDQNVNKALDSVQSRVNSVFGTGGRFGGGINQQVLAKELGDTAAGMYGQNYDQERNRQMQGMLFAPQMANQDYFDLGQLANVGAQKEGRAQSIINEDINRYNYNSNLAGNALRNYIGLTGGQFGGTQTTSTPYSGGNNSGNLLGMGLGALALNPFQTGGGLLGGLFGGGSLGLGALAAGLPWSDIRLKENIRQLGFEKGFPIYEFSYRADPHKLRYRGVMAQDVMVKRPDAVEEQGGYLAVDYGKLGIEFARIH